MASTRDDIRKFPLEVRQEIGFALYAAQRGGKALNAVPLSGFGGAGVLEVISDFDGDTYRAVYTVRFETAVYVLHDFKKKAHRGIATPRKEMDLVRIRYKQAERDYLENNK